MRVSRFAFAVSCALVLAPGTSEGQSPASVRVRHGDPSFTVEVDDVRERGGADVRTESGDSVIYRLGGGIVASLRDEVSTDGAWRARVTFRNLSSAKRKISNVVPLGAFPDRAHITAIGPPSLSRSALFSPGHGPVGVILPDNAWEMGFCDLPLNDSTSIVAIARRVGWAKAEGRRFQTILEPGGSVEYRFIAELHSGGWREGLRITFRERWLYDLTAFDDSLFRRSDLTWIRRSAVLTLFFAWDREYFDPLRGGDRFEQLLKKESRTFGGYDAFMIWPTWPRLGIDERNQWDLYRDLPGGLARLRKQVEIAHRRGTKFFIAYNPWDESTRKEDQLRGMEDILRSTNADGVVLDTRGESSRELQEAADRVRPGIIMYSEGMAVPKDMPGIVAGRVHDALVIPPPINLNKLIKPEFAIFRVLQVADARLHREILLALFNGYGVELNVMRAGRPETVPDEYRLLGRAARILRENSLAFLSRAWMPFHPSLAESVWVNQWPAGEKTIYTIYSANPRGHEGGLVPDERKPGRHYVSLWRHEETAADSLAGMWVVNGRVDPFPRSRLGTREEGSLDVIAAFPPLLAVRLEGDSLFVASPVRGELRIWRGNPSYDRKPALFPGGPVRCALSAHFGEEEGKVVVQLLEAGEILDERIVEIPPATPRMVGGIERTPLAATPSAGMVECPGGIYRYSAMLADDANPVIPYPDLLQPRDVVMSRFFIEETPVTNDAFAKFRAATRYQPRDTAGFLRHWVGGKPPAGRENHPVVWVSPEDARAYARWAGKRLPTAVEWQYAAQGTDGRKFPWGDSMDSSRCNIGRNQTTPVTAFPGGRSPFGMLDCVGNVWQLTADEYVNGAYRYVIMKGGSYYDPASSIWYVKGGPSQVGRQQMLLRGGGALDRNATVGFRCVQDAQ